ncbi:hypothetical protein BY996DRAFT_3350173 [Phakopsora pachyrhizi]|nr:hypothetical protein BY996DRAFT_3350173 [Phakopsora pachyrhizi]
MIINRMSTTTPSNNAIDTSNIQGDVVVGLHKRVQAFVFITLKKDCQSITDFRKLLKSKILPQITTIKDVMDTDERIKRERSKDRNVILPITELNISFSAAGLKKLGIPDDQLPGSDAQNDAFRSNQRSDAINNLGDPVDAQTNSLRTWSGDYLRGSIDVLLMITAPEDQLLNSKLNELEHHLRPLTEFSFVKRGNVRPDSEAGHEHFGYLVSFSQPFFFFLHLEWVSCCYFLKYTHIYIYIILK